MRALTFQSVVGWVGAFCQYKQLWAVANIVTSWSHWYTCQHNPAIHQNLALDAKQIATNHLSMCASLDKPTLCFMLPA